MIEERMNRLGEALDAAGVDILISTHTADIRWMTGFAGVFDYEQAHCALIMRSGLAESACLFTDRRYSEALRLLDKQNYWRVLDEQKRRFAYVAEVITELLGVGIWSAEEVAIGIDSDLRLDWYRALIKALDESAGLTYTLKELPGLITGLRARKTAEEFELHRAAQAITDAAYTHILGFLRPGLTERDVATELDFFMRRAGADSAAFPTIVASGPRSAVPHAVPSDRVLEHGDIVLMDFGARLNDYCTDMTRTVFLGEATEQQQEMYVATLAAQKVLFEAYKPGAEGQALQNTAEDVIAGYGFEGKLIHSLGHGVGIDIHESPSISTTSTDKLETGHVVTVEPGVYLEGIGGVRIENFGAITEHGYEDFTNSTTELIIL